MAGVKLSGLSPGPYGGTRRARKKARRDTKPPRKPKLIPRQRLDTPRPQEMCTQQFTRPQPTPHHSHHLPG
ncbi:hypothetical protein E2C01_005892 [Portunus trituberculatus]|uniref:Uncharacterized protein n=1 Tax=Portunus trituberculatus TaxID=210409 RepID=A0A5B7CUR6_PORTR|nr:hypothetical protein [Portunus trituberculatus]